MDVAITGQLADRAFRSKIARVAIGGQLRVLDMFSGAGGISLGFHRAGFSIDGALELDPDAALTHARNFHPSDVELHARPRDMTAIEPHDLIAELGLGEVDASIDILVGGPPCQAYARIGRAKLREVAEHPEAYRVDPRGNLFLRYLAYVRALKPLALLMENVPDSLRYGGINVMQEMTDALSAMGYDARYSLLNAAHYGVPQSRDRVYLVAYRRELDASIWFPAATHHAQLPRGYSQTRVVALRNIDLLNGGGFVHSPGGAVGLLPAVTAADAIGDLPSISGADVVGGAKRFSAFTWRAYPKAARVSGYAGIMRQWPGFESNGGIFDHLVRYLPRDVSIFAQMRQGAEYPEAKALAIQMAKDRAFLLGIDRRTKAYRELFDSIVPPYDDKKFANKWWKLREDAPVRTLMAHLGRDCYSHIHYSSEQARTISVREAARLQSFPDGFAFAGTLNPAFRQLGNAVPPLVAFAIASVIKATLVTCAGKVSATRHLMTKVGQDKRVGHNQAARHFSTV